MKNLKITSLALILGLVVFSACKKPTDPEPSAEEKQLALLTATWNVASVSFEGTPENDLWPNFKVIIGSKTYTASGVSAGRELVWPATGTWEFKDNDVNTLVRNDGVEISVIVDEANLSMTFTYDESINGKTTGISGDWVFKMTK